MTMDAGPRHAAVHFLLAGDPERGLAAVRVIDWGQAGSYTRMTLAGPAAHELGKDEEIESTIRAERLCGGCRPRHPDGQLMVELEVGEGQQLCGGSYTLALALADKRARGCLPRLEGRMLIASGRVKRDGSVVAVGRLADKLAALQQALARRPGADPLLILARGNLEGLSAEERGLLDDLGAAGLGCAGVASLAELGPDWAPCRAPDRASNAEDEAVRDPSPPGRGVPGLLDGIRSRTGGLTAALGWALHGLGRVPHGAGLAALVLLTVAVLAVHPQGLGTGADPCASPPEDPEVLAYCLGLPPPQVLGECWHERPGGEASWRPCPSGAPLAESDRLRLQITSAERGFIHIFHLNGSAPRLIDQKPLRADETITWPLPGRLGRAPCGAAKERVFVVAASERLPGLDVQTGSSWSIDRESLERIAEPFVVCRDGG